VAETLLRRTTPYAGVLLTLHRDEVVLPDGAESVREWIEHPGAAAVVPLFENGDTLLVRQHRYATGRDFLEVPAGKLDVPGESPAQVAARELEEESGWTAGRLEALGSMYPCIGYSDEVIHLFVATDLTPGDPDAGSPHEVTEVVRLPFDEALRMTEVGEIDDGKSVVALVRAWKWVTEREGEEREDRVESGESGESGGTGGRGESGSQRGVDA
jgi:ADP-ribose pyrophosphatase